SYGQERCALRHRRMQQAFLHEMACEALAEEARYGLRPVPTAADWPNLVVVEAEDDDRSLAERASRGEIDAFGLLYRRYVDRIYGFVYRRSGSPDVAEEVTASTFERALRGMPAFRWQGGGFGSWLFRIAANELTTLYRTQQRSTARLALLKAMPEVPAPAADTALLQADQVAEMLD